MRKIGSSCSLVALLMLATGCATEVLAPSVMLARDIVPANITALQIDEASPVMPPLGPGLFGLALAREAGRRVVRQAQIDEPTRGIRMRFLEGLQARVPGPIQSVDTPLDDDEPKALKAAVSTPLALTFETKTWFFQLASVWRLPSVFHVLYRARARLVRVSDGFVQWQSLCERQGPTRTMREFEADNWKALREDTGVMVEACAEGFLAAFTQ